MDTEKLTPENINSYKEELNQLRKEFNVLYEVSAAMRSTLALDHILHIILTGVTSHSGLGYNRALLYLLNKKTNQLECKMAIGPDSGEHANKIWNYIESSQQKLDDLIQEDKVSRGNSGSLFFESFKDLKFPITENEHSLLAQAFHKKNPWLLCIDEISPYQHDPFLSRFHTKELIIMPLRAKGAVNGLIVADNLFTQKHITKEDIRTFTLLANQAGLAIENSHLYEMVVHKSHTDSLTSLWNHGYFQECLEEEIEISKKSQNHLTLAIIDIDNFKKFNDTYGHQNGDTILKDLATILKNSSRESDFVCRYGGEEFAIILKQTSKEKGFEICERIRERIAQHKFSTKYNEVISLTVSIGVATFPDHAPHKEELIACADRSMYIAKFSGKNMTCVSAANEN